MVKVLQAFLNFCYNVWCDIHDTQSLKALDDTLDHFHKHCEIFQMTGVHLNGFNLPHSHVAVHYLHLIWAFGTPNGLCLSITESEHIKAVKEPSCRSSHWNVLKQMLTTISRLDKLVAAWVNFASHGMLEGTVLEGILSWLGWSFAALHLSSDSDILGLIVGIALGGNDLPLIKSPPALADDDELEDDNDGVDDSHVIESHVELSKSLVSTHSIFMCLHYTDYKQWNMSIQIKLASTTSYG